MFHWLKSSALVFGCLIASVSFSADLKQLTDQLDRLDQMDRQDLQVHLDAAKSCIRLRDFPCGERRLKQAEQVVVNGKDREAVARVRNTLLAEKALVEKEEAKRRDDEANIKIAEGCAKKCPIARQYEQCVRGNIYDFQCAYEETPQYSEAPSPPVNVAAQMQAAIANNMAAAGRLSNTHNNMVNNINEQARQRAELEQHQRRQQQQQQRAMEEQRQFAQRQQVEETAARNAQVRLEREREREKERVRIAQQELDTAQSSTRAQTKTLTQQAQTSSLSRPDLAATVAKPVLDADGADSDGCIEAIGWCSTAQTVETRGSTQRLIFTNTCPFRVYGTFINGNVDGKADSGASGVRAGAKHIWPTQGGNGRSFIRIVGSTKGSDWVCAGKFKNAGFAAGDSTLERR